jgi:thiol:disulfide interchange protein DsbD
MQKYQSEMKAKKLTKRKFCIAYLIYTILFLFFSHHANTTSLPIQSTINQSNTTITLKSSTESIQPNSDFWLFLDWKLNPNWYIYAQDPGDGGLPPTFNFDLPHGITVEETRWSKPKDLSKQGLIIYGYTDSCETFIRLKASADYKPSVFDTIKISLKWGICNDQCIVDDATIGLKFPAKELFDPKIIDTTHQTNQASTADVSHETSNIGLLILFAFIGGILLNLMPCVLPVLSLKLLDFAKIRNKEQTKQHTIRTHALLYTTGVLATFHFLNISLVLLRQFGHHIGWGFQLQSPTFIVFLTCLFLALTLSLFGVFEIGLRALHLESKASTQTKNPHIQSFLKGVLACIVATPCSAPFMGTAIAASLVQPFWVNSLIFTSLGIGLSLPFLALILFPNVIKFLPKPGAWMQNLKQFMGFLMLGSVGWLLWILSGRFSDNLGWILLGLWLISLGLWFYGKLCTLVKPTNQRILGGSLLLLCSLGAMGAFHYGLDETEITSDQMFEPYTQAAVDAALADKRPVLINFTARWCITCQTNKKLVLESKAIIDKLKAKNVALFMADWTHHDPRITQKLESFGTNSIPLIAFYTKKNNTETQEPILLSSIITEKQILDVLDK